MRYKIFTLIILSGLTALLYEVIWFRLLSIVFGSTTHALAIMIAAYLSGLALGAYLAGVIFGSLKDNRQIVFYLGCVQLFVGISAYIAYLLINSLSSVYAWVFFTFHLHYLFLSAVQFVLVFIIVLLPTTLLGAVFPLSVKVVYDSFPNNIGKDVGVIYALNTVGSVFGVLITTFLLIPLFGIKLTNEFGILVNFLAGGLLFLGTNVRKIVFYIILFISVIALQNITPYPVYPFSFYAANRIGSISMYNFISRQAKPLFDKDDISGRVQVFKDPSGVFLVHGGKFEGGIGKYPESAAKRLMAILPLTAHLNPKSYLQVGLGSGETLAAAQAYPDLEKIDVAEINKSLVKATNLYVNPGVLKDKNTKIIVADGRNFISLARKKYDVISIHPSWMVETSSSNFYTKDFFELLEKRLMEDGIVALWLDYWLLDRENTRIILKTFLSSFPNANTWHMKKTSVIILMGSKTKISSEENVYKRIIKRYPKFKKEFEIGVSSREFRTDKWKKNKTTYNTDDKPVVEFNSIKNFFNLESRQ